MIPPSPSISSNWSEKYFRPAGKIFSISLIEVVKCKAAECFLELLVLVCFQDAKKVKLANVVVRWNIVKAPFREEILYRGGVLIGVALLQKGCRRHVVAKGLSEWDKRIRIQVAAILFSYAHYRPAEVLSSNLLRCTTCYLAGVNYGYLCEKYQTISLPIMAHGINNLICQSASVGKISPAVGLTLQITHQVAVLILHHFGK